MILIGETGATKTDWRLIDESGIRQFSQPGFNVATHDPQVFIDNTKAQFQTIAPDIDRVYLYLSGIGEAGNELLDNLLQETFSKATIHLASDLLGAARALFGSGPGVVGILGTGANACKYDGEQLVERIPPLGYILGDEGSGNYLGKKFLAMYLRGRFSADLTKKIAAQFEGLDEPAVLRQVYGQTSNTYLGTFAKFLIDHQNEPELYPLIHQSFHAYFDAFHFSDSDKQLTHRFTGSVAHFLGNILRKVAAERGIALDLIVQSPIAGLTLYHQKNG